MIRELIVICLLVFFYGDSEAQNFQNVASAKGIVFMNQALTAQGGGVSCVDFDGDGLDDITLGTKLGIPPDFYKNTGNGFQQLTPLVPFSNESQQIIWVDYDNDGDKDLYISANLSANKLYRNDSTAGFTDVTVAAGLSTAQQETYGVCWGDINGDGWLDFYEGNQLNFGGGYNNLYLSNGNGTFTEIALNAGVQDSLRYTFSPVFLDYNHDNLPDLFVSNDRQNPSYLYENNGDSTFTNVSATTGAQLNIDGMGVGVADFDFNGHLDIYVANTMMGNKLLKNNGNGTFTEVASAMGVSLGAESWGVNFFDADHDGDLDLYVSDILSTSARPSERYFRNDDTVFSQNSNFIGDTLRGYANALGDFNNDGFYDVVCPSKYPTPLKLWENSGLPGTNWVKVELEGVVSNRDGIGSWINVYAGSDVYNHYTQCGSSYLGQNSNTKIFGLGSHTAIDSISVKWRSGHVDVFYIPATKTKHLFKEGEGMHALLSVQGQLNYCEGDSIHVKISGPAGYSSYLWNNGDTTADIHVSKAGLYYLTVKNNFGFEAISDTVEVRIDSLHLSTFSWPDTNNAANGRATVIINGGSPPYVIEWNDTLKQSGDTANGLKAGSYWVYVTDSNNCSDSTLVVIHNVIGLDEELMSGLYIYPNPASGDFFIQSINPAPLEFKIYNNTGILVREGTLEGSIRLDLKAWSPGIYFIEFRDSNQLKSSRKLFVK